LRGRQDALTGILNGVDYEEWRTSANPYLGRSYTAHDLRGKTGIKTDLQEELGLAVRPDVPLFGTVARLSEQKGVAIQLGALEEMLDAGMQFVLLGCGGREFERGYRKLALRHPGKCAVRFGFDTGLSHRIESACDFFLMPSRFEPCGLNQMYSLRYGTIPIVRLTGGLDDSVTDATDDSARADGIKFREYSVRALARAIRKALVLYADKRLLDHFRRNGMARDFSWSRTAAAYEEVYRRALGLGADVAHIRLDHAPRGDVGPGHGTGGARAEQRAAQQVGEAAASLLDRAIDRFRGGAPEDGFRGAVEPAHGAVFRRGYDAHGDGFEQVFREGLLQGDFLVEQRVFEQRGDILAQDG